MLLCSFGGHPLRTFALRIEGREGSSPVGIRLDQLSQPLPPLSLYVSHAVVLGSGESNPTLSLCLLGDPQVSKAIGMPILQCTQKRCAHTRKQYQSPINYCVPSDGAQHKNKLS